MHINFEDALKKVNKRLEEMSKSVGHEVILRENSTIEKKQYWVFFYDSKKYIETGTFSYRLLGNSPIIIDKINGEFHKSGTARPIAFYMKEFEKNKLPAIKKVANLQKGSKA